MHDVPLGQIRSPHFDDPLFKQPVASATKIPNASFMLVLIGSSRSVPPSRTSAPSHTTRRRRYSSTT
jgi:hypothetical protein